MEINLRGYNISSEDADTVENISINIKSFWMHTETHTFLYHEGFMLNSKTK